MIEYVILGTSHWVQESSDLERIVLASAANHGIVLIAEENTYNIDSTSALRAANRQRITYLQVDPPPAEWAGLGIEWEMDLRNQYFQGKDIRLSNADDLRENLWLKKIEASVGHGCVLIICGYLHVDFLAEKVKKRGGRVVEKNIFPPEYLGRKPERILDEAELRELIRKGRESGP